MSETIEAKLSRFLIEGPGAVADQKRKVDPKVATFFERLLLRIQSVPSLLTYLVDAALVDNPKKPNGSVIQLDFHRLPEEVISQVERLIAAPHPLRFMKYVKNGSARVGIEIDVSPEDFPGDAYDYGF